MMSESTSLLHDTSDDVSKKRVKLIAVIAGAIIGIVGVVTIIVTLSLQLTANSNANNSNNNPNSNQCSDYQIRYTPFSKTEPSINVDGTGILLQNATIWKANGDPILYNTDILLLNGKISQIGKGLVPEGNVTVINVNGQWVTPGLVDTHSHIGVYAYPEDAWATQDGNELTNPVLPYLRAIDGLNPNDPAIPLIRSGGVTTSLVLPGSGNVQGGEAAYVKLRGKTVYDMLIPNAPRALKMACGENPKRVYGSMGVMPDSRLGIGALQRSQWYKAAALRQQQQAYDCDPQGLRPFDIELEPLVAVLSGQARLMVHCYKVEDFEMMLRTADEFDFEIATFQHALEAWKIPDIMRDNNITIATFADNWGFKMEGFWASVWAPKILDEAGVNVALKSDHPVLFAKYLIWEASKATHYGLDPEKAMQSVTLAPAKGMGIDDRVGSLDIGKEADVVVWDRYPLQLGAQANIVIIDGQLIDNYNLSSVPRPSQTQASMVPTGPSACTNATNAYLVTGAKIYTMDENDTMVTTGSILVGADGLVKCIGECSATPGADTYTSNGGIILPGVISVGAYVGLLEVESESNSMDGTAGVLDGETIRAIDGITFNTFDPRHMYTAWAGGVTTIVAGPISSDVVAGISVAFNSHGVTVNDALVQEEVSLNVNIGNKAKSSSFTGSISGQFAYLRSLFKTNSTAFAQVMQGTMPLVVFVDQVDQIASLLRLKKEFNFNLVIVGGAEAHIIAADLAAADVAVIFTRPPPHTFETAKTVDNALTILDKAGVKVAVTTLDMSFTRNIRWEAGFAVSEGLDYYTGLKAITKNPAEMLGIYDDGVGSIQMNKKANFVLYSSDPLAIGGQVQLVALGNFAQCNPVPL